MTQNDAYDFGFGRHERQRGDANTGDYESPPKNELAFRDWLNQRFVPVFEPYQEAGGIPTAKLKDVLNVHFTGMQKLHQQRLLKRADIDRNGRVTYQEFYRTMIRLRKEDMSRGDKLMYKFITAFVPSVKLTEKRRKKLDAVDYTDTGGVPEKDLVMESYIDAYNCRPPPIFIAAISLAQIICFAVYGAEIDRKAEPTNKLTWSTGVPTWSPLMYAPWLRNQVWRFFTYCFIHQGYQHIIFNMILQLLFGLPLETVHKFWRVIPVYMIGVTAGSLGVSIFDPSTALCGASGGVYALVGAHYATCLMNWEEMQHDWLNCTENPMRILTSGVMRLFLLSLFLLLDFGFALYRRYGQGINTPISIAAHGCGLLAGILTGITCLDNIDVKVWEKYVFWIAVVVFVILVVFAVFWNIFYRGFPVCDATATLFGC